MVCMKSDTRIGDFNNHKMRFTTDQRIMRKNQIAEWGSLISEVLNSVWF
jgi:hypothetical protein